MAEYKSRNYILNYLSDKPLSDDVKENLELIKTLSDDFTTDDETAHELDELLYIELQKLYADKHKENMKEYRKEKETTTTETPLPEAESNFKGIEANYKNQFEINQAIEALLDSKEVFDDSEKMFLTKYTGAGGLQKEGATGAGLLYEYYTPEPIIKKMWALAYKYGYKGGRTFESSCGVGRFIKFAPDKSLVTGYEINKYSAKISTILYPEANIVHAPFESIFIKNNNTIKNKLSDLPKFDLNIGNPPYGNLQGKFFGMGEKDYTKAHNFVEYFIYRGLDLLVSGGLLIFIVGAEVKNGGKLFLSSGETPCKEMISQKADLLEAYRLPAGIFENTGVTTEIIVIRKK